MTRQPGFLPWQTELACSWLGETERFAHAWLIHGLAGIGKREFAIAAAAALLCEQPESIMACGTCQACRWFSSGNHPDFRRIRPDAVAVAEGEIEEDSSAQAKKSPSREIRVEQIRSLSGWFNTATHRGGWRVAVIYPAQAMNAITANALLKVLEEPPPRTVFLLTTDAPDLLLPTIVSRCRRLPLPVPPAAEAHEWLLAQGVQQPGDWLAVAGGAPLSALELAQSGEAPCPAWLQGFLSGLAAGRADINAIVSTTSDALDNIAPGRWIDGLQRAFIDLSLANVGVEVRYFPSQATVLARIAAVADSRRINDTSKWLSQQKRVAGHPLSPKLFAQSVLQRCALACRPVVLHETS